MRSQIEDSQMGGTFGSGVDTEGKRSIGRPSIDGRITLN